MKEYFKKLFSWVRIGKQLLISVPYGWLLIFFAIPFLIILKISFSEPVWGIPPYEHLLHWEKVDELTIHLYFGNYRVVFTDALYLLALLGSLKIAFITTCICLLLGYPMAYAIAQCPRGWQHILILLIVLPFWTSFLLRVYAWMGLLSPSSFLMQFLSFLPFLGERVSLIHTTFAACLGMVYCYLPFMILPIYTHLQQFDHALVEAAADLGCRPLKTFFRVIVPLSKKGIITGCILVFIPAAGEFVVPELLGGADTLMVGKILWVEFFSNRDWPMAATLATFLLIFLLVPLIFLQPKKAE